MNEKIVHELPEDLADKGARIARHACNRYSIDIFVAVAVASVIAGREVVVSLVILVLVFSIGLYSRLLRTYERQLWALMLIFSVFSVVFGYLFTGIEFDNELLETYPAIQQFIPVVFAIPSAIVADRIGSKIERLFYRSKGYDFRGRLGHVDFVEDNF